MVYEKTGGSSGFRVNQYKQQFLSLISLNLVLIFVCWYKQPIISAKQPIVFLVLLFLLAVLANWIPCQLFLEIISFLT